MLNEMLTYLIASAKNTDIALDRVFKTLKKQARFNRQNWPFGCGRRCLCSVVGTPASGAGEQNYRADPQG